MGAALQAAALSSELELKSECGGPAGPRERRFSAMRAFEAFVMPPTTHLRG